MRRTVLSILLVLACTGLRAQFSLSGSDPSSVRWMRMDTPRFSLIYPSGEDSLAIVYGSWLEKVGKVRGRTPVILHSFNTLPNASVTWAPKRMDIYTVMDPYSPTPMPWEKHLAIHEGRHVAQMLSLETGRNKAMKVLLGEMFPGALAGIFPGRTILEGDAVVAETAFTSSGRGRQASFLSYFAPAFDCGDWRDYWRWSYGSKRLYTPDYYRPGYMLISGMRVFFNDPLFTDEYFSRISGKGLFFNLQKTVRAASGMGLRKAFRSIEESYRGIWDEEAAARAPFMPSEQVSKAPWRHVEYSGTVLDASGIWSEKAGLLQSKSLVRLAPDGTESRIRSFSSYSCDLAFDGARGRIYWSESVPHWRWTLAGSSRIRYVDTSSPSAIHDLTTTGKYFNPAPSPDGSLVCVTEYPPSGGSRLVLLDSSDGSVKEVFQAPDTLQVTESTWIGSRLFTAALSSHGMGIYEVDGDRGEDERLDGEAFTRTGRRSRKRAIEPFAAAAAETIFKKLIGPQPVELSHLRAAGQQLHFVCDRTGVNEMYALDVASGTLFQVTSTRYGIEAPCFNATGDTLFYSSLAPSDNPGAYKQGKMIYSTPASDLPMKEVSFDEVLDYKVASALSAQEKSLSPEIWQGLQEYSETEFSAPQPYHHLLPKLHSWAPVYFNYDRIDDISGDDYYKAASVGATAMFQNLAGEGYAILGYGAHEDPDGKGWRHSGHFKYFYSGWIPVIELSADLGDRVAFDYTRVRQNDKEAGRSSTFTSGRARNEPFFEGQFRAYLPVNLTSGGISRGIVPQIKVKLTNDRLNDRISLRDVTREGDKKVPKEVGHLGKDHSAPVNTMDLSVRGYLMREKAPSQVYPSLGIGAEAGLHSRPGHLESYSNTAYFYSYCYLPGILQNQGIRLSATLGCDLGGGNYSYPESPVSFVPRGFADTNLKAFGNSFSPARYRFTFDYVAPLLDLDWSWLCPAAYIKNLVLTPFADYSYQKFNSLDYSPVKAQSAFSGNLLSIGADLAFNLGNFLWVPYETQIGVRYAHNSWSGLGGLPLTGLEHDYFGMIFSISI